MEQGPDWAAPGCAGAPLDWTRCDNHAVGVLIHDAHGRVLVIDRDGVPGGIAPPSAHLDGHPTPRDAAWTLIRTAWPSEIRGDVTLAASAWRPNRCGRTTGPVGTGHLWSVFRARVAAPARAADPPAGRWWTRDELGAASARTLAQNASGAPGIDWLTAPGLSPVWVSLLLASGVLGAREIDRAARLADGRNGADALAALDAALPCPPPGAGCAPDHLPADTETGDPSWP